MIGSYIRRARDSLLKHNPFCDLCGKHGRALDPASPEEGPRCMFFTSEDIENWQRRASSLEVTLDLIRELWPEAGPAKVSRGHTAPATIPGESRFERAKRALRIEQVAGELTQLRGGHTLKGKCPLHDEQKGESLVIWTEIQAWRCYGKCAAGGDVIEFVRRAMERGLWR